MPKDIEKQRLLTRRAIIFGGMQATAFTALAGRLFYLQLIRAGEYKTLSENNRIKLQLIAPERGHILDRNGFPMAVNEKNYRLFFDAGGLTAQNVKDELALLRTLVALPEKTLKTLEHFHASPAPLMLKDHLTWEEVSHIELNRLSLPGVSIDISQLRHYPLGEKAAHLLGYVGSVAQEDISDNDPLMRLPDFKIGKSGCEKMLEERLRGTPGIHEMEVNVHGVQVREVSQKESHPGESVRLTIDSRLQEFAAERARNESASIVVIEVATGNVLTLASMPAFDPDQFSKTITTDDWDDLMANKKSPLLNKSIAGLYPPGSTFKMLVGLAGLEAGAITQDSTVTCPGYFLLGDHRFNCWKEGGHGTVNFHKAVQQSCDTFFYTVAQRIGPDAYANMARRFGLGQSQEIGLPGEKTGDIPDPAWKWKRYQEKWSGGDTINCAIGQGYVLATPLQLAVMVTRMASGKQVVPRLIVPAGEEAPQFKPMHVDEALLDLNRDAMSAVVNEPGGTGGGSAIHDETFLMAGKTGTSQVKKILQRGYNQNLLPWEFRHHALFVAFAPVEEPRYACAVIVEHGGGGASAAAPIARDVLLKARELEKDRA